MSGRDLVAAAAVVSVLAGVVFAIVPSLGMQTPVPQIPVGILGGLAVVFALLAATGRRHLTREAAEFPAVEERHTANRPGATFDATFDRTQPRRAGQSRRKIRRRLHEDAVEVLTMTEGITEAEAQERLATGDWTDDPHAAALFAEEPPSLPFRVVVRNFFGNESTFERRVRHVVHELRDRVEGA